MTQTEISHRARIYDVVRRNQTCRGRQRRHLKVPISRHAGSMA